MSLEPKLTVEEVLTLPPLRGSRLLAGAAGLGRIVSGVNQADIPDYEEWLSPDELLVTKCYALRDDLPGQRGLVPTLALHGAAGLCVKPHPFLTEVPDFMLRAADEAGLPLIELPPETVFREIIWAVFEALQARAEASFQPVENPALLAFLRHLLLDPVTDEAAERERGRYLDCDLTGPFRVVRFQILSAGGGSRRAPAPAQTFFLYRDLLSMLRNSGLACAATVDGKQLLLVLSTGQALPPPDRLEPVLRHIMEALASGHPSLRFLLGYSRPGAGTAGMRQCCREARAAIQHCRGDSPVQVQGFAQLGLSRLLCAGDPAAEAGSLAADVLGPLLSDRDRGEELLATLECYFQCLGNLRRVSEVLHTHYNTVAYRVRQLQDLTGLNLHDPDERFLLELAARLFREKG